MIAKVNATTSLLAIGALGAVASAGYTGMSYDYLGDSGYGDTFRVYANMESGDRLDAVYGDGDNALTIDGSFYQNAFGGPTSASINPALIAVFPSLAYDSWVTIGLEDQTGNVLADIGIDWSSFEGGGGISTSDGAWYITPDDVQGEAVDGRVLIAQLTVTGDPFAWSGYVNLQGKLADGSTWSAEHQYFGPMPPAPGAIGLLAIAGLASRRRRVA